MSYADWIGRTERLYDTVTPTPIAALSATLDRDDAPPQSGHALPPLWHWLYFLPIVAARELGEDGHPKRGGLLPPVTLQRRMWAGGRLRFHRPLRVGDAIERISRVGSVRATAGRSGDLVFVTVAHELHGAQGLAIEEEQDLVYLGPAHGGTSAPEPGAAPDASAFTRRVFPDPVLLFRYSALTFNGHRIHYDETYATQIEGYSGLVLHCPLVATLLVDLLRRERPRARLRTFEFRAASPLICPHDFTLHGQLQGENGVRLWARSHRGQLAMSATGEIEV